MFLARLAEGLGTFHTAFAHARGVKPMELPKMSAKAKERFEKAKAERDKDNDRLVNYAITLGKIKAADRDFNFRVAQAEQQQSNADRTFDAGRQDRADDVAFRDKKFDTDNEHWQKGFDENQRQFDITSREHAHHNRASEGLQGASLTETIRHNKVSEDGKYTEFYSGNGMVRVPNTRLNQHNISYVYKQTGLPLTKTTRVNGRLVETALTAEEMMQRIGTHIDDPNVQSALRAIGGQTSTNDNTPPSRRTNNNNTPPSRR
jgi:hypothetical protein